VYKRCTRCGRLALVILLTGGLCAPGQDHDLAGLPAHQPDTGAEWAYRPAVVIQTSAAGTAGGNATFAYAGVAQGRGQAFDATVVAIEV